MKKKFFYYVGIGLCIVSCQDEVIIDGINLERTPLVSDYTIPVDSALKYLLDYLSLEDKGAVAANKSARCRIVSSISAVSMGRNKSLALNTDANDKLLYVANFEGDQGFAILAADSRINENIIAVADQGNLDVAIVNQAIENQLSGNDRIVYDGYPLDGPGLFTTPETGDEIFLNPNTFTLYQEKEKEELVGVLDMYDDEGEEDENGNPIVHSNPSSANHELLTSELCVAYAINQINDYEKASSTNSFDLYRPIDDGDCGGGGAKTTKTITTSLWNTTKAQEPILAMFAAWSQHSPFNDYCPYRRKFAIMGHRKKASAGCFPLAISKIMTLHEHPTVFDYNNYIVDWKELKKSSLSSVGNASAATLLRGIGLWCDSWYFYNGTFTFPSRAISFMRSIGYRNVDDWDYRTDRVIKMLDENKPVIIYAMSGSNISVWKSHAWNIDGYKIQERTTITKTYRGGTLVKTEEKKETREMVHCDFGWKGKSNGYYISGVFDTDNPTEADGEDKGDSFNYKYHQKIIMYEMPY